VSAQRDLLAGWRAWRARSEAPAPGTAHAEATPTAALAPDPTEAEALARALAAFAEEAFAALTAPDPERDAERIVMAEHYAGEPTADPYQPGDRDPLRDGLWAGAQARVLSGPKHIRGAGARRFSGGRPKKRSYCSETARRPVPLGERLEGEVAPAAGSEFRHE
jgi:hypothetical protein